MNETLTPEQIEAAAQWWADRLTSCRHSGLSTEERRRPENSGYQFAEMLMTIARPIVTDDQAALFKASLVTQIGALQPYALGVDYNPCRELAAALDAAGIPNCSTLPIKTTMWLTGGKVEVRYGYGAPVVSIYPL